MSYGGYEYNAPSNGGGYGFDPLGGVGGGFAGPMEGAGAGFDGAATTGSASKPDKKASRDRQTLLPLTVKQLHSIVEEDGVNKLDGVEVFTVRIVGTILSVEAHATNILYTISDGTGVVECKCFVEKESNAGPKYPDCGQQTMVRVNGNIRTYEGRKSLMIYNMNAISDWNEVTHHNLEVIYTHLRNTKGPLQVAPATGAAVASSNSSAAMGGSGSGGMGSFSGNMGAGTPVNKLMDSNNANPVNVLRDQILTVYRTTGAEDSGPNFQEVMVGLTNLGVNITMNQLMREVEYLSGEGQLYTTIDEYHYKTTVGAY